MTLSPVSAISDLVAPVVLITAATMFVNGLMTAATTVIDNAFAQQRRTPLKRAPLTYEALSTARQPGDHAFVNRSGSEGFRHRCKG